MASRAERVEAAARALVEIVEDVDAADVIEECVLVPVKDWDLIRAALALPADEATRADAAGAEAVAREAHKAARAEALEEAALWHEDEARRISGEIAASLQIMRENASAFVGLNTSMDHEYAQAETHREAADIIRALKDKEPA